MDSGLTVEKAKTTIRQKAAVLEQGQELESDKKRESLSWKSQWQSYRHPWMS